jgi:hypothetical protein
MADVTQKILEPATSMALVTLDELKMMIGQSGSESDAQLQFLIDANSSAVARLCNRIFAKEKLTETWRELSSRRLYLTHWPVKEADIESVMTNDETRLDFELDEREGKLSIFTNRLEPIAITYTGGFNLPGEAPPALKQAVSLLVSSTKAEQSAASLTGVRMIAHKESRVMFHSPTSGGSSGSTGGSSAQTRDTVKALLGHYVKHWI